MTQRFNQWMGFQQGEAPGTLILDTRPEHEVMPGTIHFAVLTTLAEVSASQVAEAPIVPTNVQIQLLRRAAPGRLVGKGILLKRGKRLVFCEGEVYQDDRLVAKATIQFAVVG